MFNISEEEFLKIVYILNNKSFSNYEEWLDVPLVTIAKMLKTASWWAAEERKAMKNQR